MLTQEKKQKIALEVLQILVLAIQNNSYENIDFANPFLRAFSDKLTDKVSDIPFFISLVSWLHGLNTTLGQQFFERVAHILSSGEKREYTSKKLGNLQISKTQKDKINEIMTALSNGSQTPNVEEENRAIFINDDSELVNALDFSADIFIEDETSIIAIELKSVKPNSGEMRGEKQKILEGKAALFRKFPNKKINFFMGFPFDPTANPQEPTSFEKSRFLASIINMTKSFHPNETLVASELWDLLSDESNTMEQVLEIINNISTPNFLEEFAFLCENENRTESEYIEKLKKWHIYSEIELIEKNSEIVDSIRGDKILTRLYNQKLFDDKGNYNLERFEKLKNLIGDKN